MTVKFVGNIPLILGGLIVAAFSIDAPVLRSLKTESTYGLWVAVLVPLAIVLLIIQIVLWIRWPSTRPISWSK